MAGAAFQGREESKKDLRTPGATPLPYTSLAGMFNLGYYAKSNGRLLLGNDN